jgi:hypothetical protein
MEKILVQQMYILGVLMHFSTAVYFQATNKPQTSKKYLLLTDAKHLSILKFKVINLY